jgi:Tol biopolymer transport system component
MRIPRCLVVFGLVAAILPLPTVGVGSSVSAGAFVDTFHGLSPARVLDTRSGTPTVDGQFQGIGALGPGAVLDLALAGRAGVPVGAAAVALNVTVTEPTAGGFLTVFPSGAPAPNAANVNFTPGATVGNSVVMSLGTGGAVSILNSSGTSHVVVDVLGWFPTAQAFSGLTPARLLDTRPGFPTTDGQFAGLGASLPSSTRQLTVTGRGGVPADAVAVALNVAVTAPTSGGYLTVFPNGVAVPNAANLNFEPGQTVSNLVIVDVGDAGQISWFNSAGSTQVVVDVLGWFGVGVIEGLVPARLLDTRTGAATIDGLGAGGGPVTGGSTIDVQVRGRGGVRTSAGSVAINVTVTEPTASTFLTVFPKGATRPLASNLNADAGRTVPNLVIVPVGAEGKVSIYQNAGAAHLVVDVLAWFPSAAIPSLTERVSVRSAPADTQIPALRSAQSPAISADGRYVAFVADAMLVDGFPNDMTRQVYVRDRVTGITTLISSSSTGTPGDDDSLAPSISADGRYVAFQSDAGNLLPGGIPSSAEVFVKDRVANTLERVAVTPTGAVGNGSTNLLPSISSDGRYVVFLSDSSDLVAGDANGALFDVFRRDRVTGTTLLVSRTAGGGQSASGVSQVAPDLSDDGSVVAFASTAGDLVPGDANGFTDVFVRHVGAATTVRVVPLAGTGKLTASNNPRLDASGRYLTFDAGDVFVRDLVAGVTTRISAAPDGAAANGVSTNAAVSPDGRWVAFQSSATNLVADDTNATTDVFLHDRLTGATIRVSVANDGSVPTSGSSSMPSVATGGRLIAFASRATTLVADDTNDSQDIFVRDRGFVPSIG